MMAAGQPMFRDVLDRLDHDVAQGVGDPAFIGQQTLDLLLGIIFHSRPHVPSQSIARRARVAKPFAVCRADR